METSCKKCNDGPLLAVAIFVGGLVSENDARSETLLSNEYGKEDNCKEFQRILQDQGYSQVSIHTVTLKNYKTVLNNVQFFSKCHNDAPIVILQLLDGTELDGYPGLTVVKEIEQRRIPYTGSNSSFYLITTDKIPMKHVLKKKNVPTSDFVEIVSIETVKEDVGEATKQLGFPMIVKPSISYSSLGISDKSIVHTVEEAIAQVKFIFESPLNQSGVFIERFLPGREYTVLVVGDEKAGIQVFTPAERVFNSNLLVEQRILSFDRYWAGYGLDGKEPDASERLYSYQPANNKVQQRLKDLSIAAYLALDGNGYGRVDIRSDDMADTNLFVLEVNANCGLSFTQSSSMGEILQMSKIPGGKFLHEVVSYALCRGM